MNRETLMINVWVVSYFNAIEGLHYNNLHTTCDEATADFDKISNDAMTFALEEMTDFRVSRNLNSVTICDFDDDRVIIVCEVSEQTIPCGIMCM